MCRVEASGCSRTAQPPCDCAHARWKVAPPRTGAECALQPQCRRPSRHEGPVSAASIGPLFVPSRPFFARQLVTHHTHGWARHGWLGTGCSSPCQHRAPSRRTMWYSNALFSSAALFSSLARFQHRAPTRQMWWCQRALPITERERQQAACRDNRRTPSRLPRSRRGSGAHGLSSLLWVLQLTGKPSRVQDRLLTWHTGRNWRWAVMEPWSHARNCEAARPSPAVKPNLMSHPRRSRSALSRTTPRRGALLWRVVW